MSEASAPANRLAQEKSPYLLQHAHNPVDWYPWGVEAFEKARLTDRPVLLSIGYATCHWCHVMERESFENPETAAVMNEHFIAIKLDREERPDVDQIYMRALHATGQQGGWPLNMFLTPERQPITGGTYFPPEPRYGRPSFVQVLESIARAWREDREKLLNSAKTLTEWLEQDFPPNDGAALPSLEASKATYESLLAHFDEYRGGFTQNGPNKFPPSMSLLFLLEYHRRNPDSRALAMVESTLDRMRRGGIYDQVGGGLSRYATDHDWLVPHFEKMLYDNALFAWALVDCFRVTRNERYREWALDVFEYIERDMTSQEGAFFSAEDADSEGEEGKFYVWKSTELEEALSDTFTLEERKMLLQLWGVSARGNFEGKNILFEPMEREAFLRANAVAPENLQALLDRARRRLLEARNERVRPLRDDKVLTAWNALMISALCQAARAFSMPPLAERARRAINFIEEKLRPDGRLLRRYREGDARFAATLTDLALYGGALLDCYRATFDEKLLENARNIAAQIRGSFASTSGLFYESEQAASDLLVRSIETYDGVEPSGNASAFRLFSWLASYGLDIAENRKAADGILRTLGGELAERGSAHSFLVRGLFEHLNPGSELAIVLPEGASVPEETLSWVEETWGPDSVVALGYERAGNKSEVPLLDGRNATEGRPTYYLCQQFVCRTPVHSLSELQSLRTDS